MIHVNNLGCLARDLNVTVLFQYGKYSFLRSNDSFRQRFITSEEAFNLVEVAILALSK